MMCGMVDLPRRELAVPIRTALPVWLPVVLAGGVGLTAGVLGGMQGVLELLLATVGAWLAWRRGRHRLLLLAVVVILYFDVVYTPIKSVFHYSLVVVPFLCLLQAFVVAWVVWRVRRRPEAGEPAAGS